MKFTLSLWVAVFSCCGQASNSRRVLKKAVLDALRSDAGKHNKTSESKYDKESQNSMELPTGRHSNDKHDKQPSKPSALLEGLDRKAGKLPKSDQEELARLTKMACIAGGLFLLVGCSCCSMMFADKFFGKKDGVGERMGSVDSMGHARTCEDGGMEARTAAGQRQIHICEDTQQDNGMEKIQQRSQSPNGSPTPIARIKHLIYLEALKKQASDMGDFNEAERLKLVIQTLQKEATTAIMSKDQKSDGIPVDRQAPGSFSGFLSARNNNDDDSDGVKAANTCACGNNFMPDAAFCKMCGRSRPKDSSVEKMQHRSKDKDDSPTWICSPTSKGKKSGGVPLFDQEASSSFSFLIPKKYDDDNDEDDVEQAPGIFAESPQKLSSVGSFISDVSPPRAFSS